MKIKNDVLLESFSNDGMNLTNIYGGFKTVSQSTVNCSTNDNVDPANGHDGSGDPDSGGPIVPADTTGPPV